MRVTVLVTVVVAGVLAGCASQAPGPQVMALPGSSASWGQFQADDVACQAYAANAAGLPADQAARNAAVDSAVVGTVIGATAGALIGAASGDTGSGAAVGAGVGLLAGSAAGSEAYAVSGASRQGRYDTVYVQCMYAAGHQVPVPVSAAALANRPPGRPVSAGPPAGTAAPSGPGGTPAYPPPGTPPPPGY